MPIGSTTPHELIRLVDPIKGAGNKSWMQKLSRGGHGTGISFINGKINKVTLMEKNVKPDHPKPEATYDLNAEFIRENENSYKVIFTGGPTE